MRTAWTHKSVWISLTLFSVAASSRVVKTPRILVQILRCYDADTCTVQTQQGIELDLRFAGIDAPELATRKPFKGRHWPEQAWARQAREHVTRDLKTQREWWIEIVTRDFFRRQVAWIFLSPQSSRPRQLDWVSRGWVHAAQSREDAQFERQLLFAEAQAKAQKLGLWASRAEIPAEFRKRYTYKNKRVRK